MCRTYIITSIFFGLFILPCKSQTINTVDSLDNECQACLDEGKFMLGCTITFYNQMDSLLNKVYKKLRSSLDSSKRDGLIKEEKEWLRKRDKYFNQTRAKLEKVQKANGYLPQDDEMFMYEDNARFVKKRILELIKRLNN